MYFPASVQRYQVMAGNVRVMKEVYLKLLLYMNINDIRSSMV